MTDMIVHHFGGGVYAKETNVPEGMVLVQHKHDHEHLSILAQGRVEMVVEGIRSEIEGPACIRIAAGKYHGIKALTPVTWYCIHATDCKDENEIDEVIISSDSSTDEAQALAEAML